jgi:hypothetical protein
VGPGGKATSKNPELLTPSGTPLLINWNVPVGLAPLLCVLRVTSIVTGDPTMGKRGSIVTVVGALVIVIGTGEDVLAV